MAKLGMPSVNIAFIEQALKQSREVSAALWHCCLKKMRTPSQSC